MAMMSLKGSKRKSTDYLSWFLRDDFATVIL